MRRLMLAAVIALVGCGDATGPICEPKLESIIDYGELVELHAYKNKNPTAHCEPILMRMSGERTIVVYLCEVIC